MADWNTSDIELQLVEDDEKRDTLSDSITLYECNVPLQLDGQTIEYYGEQTWSGGVEAYPLYHPGTRWKTVNSEHMDSGSRIYLFETEDKTDSQIQAKLKRRIKEIYNDLE